MNFRLNKDKHIVIDIGERLIHRRHVLAGEYPIVRVFDKNRVLVDLSRVKRKRMLTLLNIDKGEILDGQDK